jgi:hypothetical protein
MNELSVAVAERRRAGTKHGVFIVENLDTAALSPIALV